LTKKSTAEPALTVEAAGTLRYTLVVNDGVLDSEPDTVEIVVPERQFGGDAEGACASANAPAWLALLPAFAAWTRRRA